MAYSSRFLTLLTSTRSKMALTTLLLTPFHIVTARLDNKEGEKLKAKKTVNDKDPKDSMFRTFTEFIPEDFRSSSSEVKAFFESGVPHQVGYGFLMGYSSGFCLKKVSKILAFALGGLFIAVQTLSYNGYINVHYERVQKEVESMLDLNNDGKCDADDLSFGLEKVRAVLGDQMPAGGGFTAGLVMGLRG